MPFEPKLIDFGMMSPGQIEWFNYYNSIIQQTIRPYFVDRLDTMTTDWIDAKTQYVDPAVSMEFQKYASSTK